VLVSCLYSISKPVLDDERGRDGGDGLDPARHPGLPAEGKHLIIMSQLIPNHFETAETQAATMAAITNAGEINVSYIYLCCSILFLLIPSLFISWLLFIYTLYCCHYNSKPFLALPYLLQ
jgi:hypothetical protein